MKNDVALAIAILLPVIVITVLRVDAAITYLSLCLGYVLVQFVGGDTNSLMTAFFPHASSLSQSTIKLIFLFVPVLLTIIATFHSVRGTKLVLNLLPAIGVGLLGVLLVEPLLSAGIRGSLAGSNIWHGYLQAQTLIVGVSALVSLIFLWVQKRSSNKASKHHSKS